MTAYEQKKKPYLLSELCAPLLLTQISGWGEGADSASSNIPGSKLQLQDLLNPAKLSIKPVAARHSIFWNAEERGLDSQKKTDLKFCLSCQSQSLTAQCWKQTEMQTLLLSVQFIKKTVQVWDYRHAQVSTLCTFLLGRFSLSLPLLLPSPFLQFLPQPLVQHRTPHPPGP